ncbi:anthranilate synthase component 1 [Rhizomicrobium palustre]|uniref:Anthranilate synthase component 1 n=1 Tax=Rhizomicrobium palustre TaxID=189966 RepID=A0A846N3A7_9PROT|nr:anthranilate synthase component I [Rhizomicrobium palustre]NIK89702.1 anthranilate synthase component 1 [Rhizomicrobium palustre]
MAIEPDFTAFAAGYENGQPQVLYTRLIADLETPVSAYLKLAEGRQNAFLLESVQGGETRGRYSIVGLKPDLIWRFKNGKAEINRNARADADAFEPDAETNPLTSLRGLLKETRMTLPAGLPPMAVGLYGYLGYDMVRLIEKLPNVPPDTLGLPDAILMRPSIVAIFDSVRDEIVLVSPVWPQAGVDARAAYARTAERINDTIADLERPLPVSPALPEGALEGGPVQSNMAHDDYLAMVAKAKEYILAGDIFQVVPSQRFRRPFNLPSFSLYRALRRLNPSPYLYHLAFPGFSVVGSSPEVLVRLRDGKVTIRPIAGTRWRGKTPEEDKALAEELQADPKERAEHLMLIDLGRNDVGRIAKTGKVTVTDSFFIERYSHVMHLVSNVEGEIRDDLDAVDALAAGLPAGTLTGAPKIRAMEIIDEFEKEKRGAAYAGAVGYFAADGSMDTCIMLRTALVKDGTMYVQAGGGIVADSVPEAEYQETVNKAKALMSAADEAVRFASAGKRGQ